MRTCSPTRHDDCWSLALSTTTRPFPIRRSTRPTSLEVVCAQPRLVAVVSVLWGRDEESSPPPSLAPEEVVVILPPVFPSLIAVLVLLGDLRQLKRQAIHHHEMKAL